MKKSCNFRQSKIMVADTKIKEKVNKYLDNADDRILKIVHAILKADADHDFWDNLPSVVREDIDIALLQSAAGHGTKHEEVMAKYKQ